VLDYTKGGERRYWVNRGRCPGRHLRKSANWLRIRPARWVLFSTLRLVPADHAVFTLLYTLAKIQTLALALFGMVLVACENEQPPRTVQEFLADPIMLEAAVVRCARNRAESRYDAECINAREAAVSIEAREEAAQRKRWAAESERKRQALRRSRDAADAARRQAEAERRRQEEGEYLAQFGDVPEETPPEVAVPANAPVALLPDPPETTELPEGYETPESQPADPVPTNAPVALLPDPPATIESSAASSPDGASTVRYAEPRADGTSADLASPIVSEGAELAPAGEASPDLGDIREALRERNANDQG
jgi:hypothetical protein